VVGSCVYSASNDVLYYAISAGSLSFVFDGIKATVFNSGASLGSVLFSTGYSMHLGDVSISKSLEDSSWVLAIFLVYTIFQDFQVSRKVSEFCLCM
jgi:hypothetical protein